MSLAQDQALYEPDWYASYTRLGRPQPSTDTSGGEPADTTSRRSASARRGVDNFGPRRERGAAR